MYFALSCLIFSTFENAQYGISCQFCIWKYIQNEPVSVFVISFMPMTSKQYSDFAERIQHEICIQIGAKNSTTCSRFEIKLYTVSFIPAKYPRILTIKIIIHKISIVLFAAKRTQRALNNLLTYYTREIKHLFKLYTPQ